MGRAEKWSFLEDKVIRRETWCHFSDFIALKKTFAAHSIPDLQFAVDTNLIAVFTVSLRNSLRDADDIATPQGINNATPVLQVTIPLLRGRGREVNTARTGRSLLDRS
jgi:hypothetical protein